MAVPEADIQVASDEGFIKDDIAAILADAGYAHFELNAEGYPDFVRPTAQNQFAVPAETVNAFASRLAAP